MDSWKHSISVPRSLRQEFGSKSDAELQRLAETIQDAVGNRIGSTACINHLRQNGWSPQAAKWYCEKAYNFGGGFWPHAKENPNHNLLNDWETFKRKFAFAAIGLIAVLMFIYPPMGRPYTYGRTLWSGYMSIFDQAGYSLVIDWPRLVAQYIGLGIGFKLLAKRWPKSQTNGPDTLIPIHESEDLSANSAIKEGEIQANYLGEQLELSRQILSRLDAIESVLWYMLEPDSEDSANDSNIPEQVLAIRPEMVKSSVTINPPKYDPQVEAIKQQLRAGRMPSLRTLLGIIADAKAEQMSNEGYLRNTNIDPNQAQAYGQGSSSEEFTGEGIEVEDLRKFISQHVIPYLSPRVITKASGSIGVTNTEFKAAIQYFNKKGPKCIEVEGTRIQQNPESQLTESSGSQFAFGDQSIREAIDLVMASTPHLREVEPLHWNQERELMKTAQQMAKENRMPALKEVVMAACFALTKESL